MKKNYYIMSQEIIVLMLIRVLFSLQYKLGVWQPRRAIWLPANVTLLSRAKHEPRVLG